MNVPSNSIRITVLTMVKQLKNLSNVLKYLMSNFVGICGHRQKRLLFNILGLILRSYTNVSSSIYFDDTTSRDFFFHQKMTEKLLSSKSH